MDQSRRSWMSYALFFGIFLSPVLLQPVDCERGNPNLASLEFESEGQNQIVAFSPSQTVYDVSVGSSPAILRAYSQDATATVSYRFWDNSVFIDTVPLGTGGGVANITVPEGQSTFQVSVATREGGSQFYSMNVVHAAAGFPCTEQGIRDAIAAGGGPHYFDCEGQPPVQITSTIDINNDVILDGEGNLTVDGGNAYGVFSVPAGVTAELAGITVRGGPLTQDGDRGGGILNEGVLRITDSTVRSNGGMGWDFASTYEGGGIYNSGTLTLQGSTILENDAIFGAGIYNTGTATLIASDVSRNGNYDPATGSYVEDGSGIYNDGTLTLIDSSVTLNSDGFGDAAAIDNRATMRLISSLVSNNLSTQSAGILCSGSSTTLVNSTVSGNSGGIASAIEKYGGTLNLLSSALVEEGGYGDSTILLSNANLIVQNSLIAHNSPSIGACLGASNVTSGGGNIESDTDTCGLTDPTDLVNVTAEELDLGPLDDYGGPTMTHALLSSSVAIDHVPTSMCVDENSNPLTVDQRGETRPQGVACDAGAFEWADCASTACEDGNVCTSYACNSSTGLCQITPVDGTPCSPAPQCDPGDGRCSAGVCESISGCGDLCFGVTCLDDGNECTTDDEVCDPSTGRCGLPVPDGTSCDSGNAQCSAGGCRGPFKLDAYDNDASDPHVAMNRFGAGMAIWSEQGPGPGDAIQVFARAYDLTNGWGPPVRIDSGTTDARAVDVTIAQDGQATAVWSQGGDYWSNRYSPGPGGGWGVAQPITTSGNPVSELLLTHRNVVLWVEQQGGTETIWRNVYSTAQNNWSTSPTEVAQAGELSLADYDSDPNGTTSNGSFGGGMVVWLEQGPGGPYVWARRQNSSGSWQAPYQVGVGADYPYRPPQVVMDSSVDAIVVWTTADEIWTRRNTGPAELLATAHVPLTASEVPGELTASLSLATASMVRGLAPSDQDAIVAWAQVNGAETDLWIRRYSRDDGIWEQPERLETHDGWVQNPKVSFSGHDEWSGDAGHYSAVVVWERCLPPCSDPTSTELWINRYVMTPYPNLGPDQWGMAERIAFMPGSSKWPKAAMDAIREGAVVWSQQSSDGDVYALDSRWTLSPAPVLSNARVTHVGYHPSCASQPIPGHYYRYQADYRDPDGDIVATPQEDAVRVFIDREMEGWWSIYAGFPDIYESEYDFNNQVTGDGFSGTVTANNCLTFGDAEWADISITIWDTAGNQSINTVTDRIDKPAGAP